MCSSCGDKCVSCFLSCSVAHYSKNTMCTLVELTASFQGRHKIFTLKKEAGDFFETAVNIYQHTLLHDFHRFSIYICHLIV
jgi:hypothetical protein